MTARSLDPASPGFRRRRLLLTIAFTSMHAGALFAWIPVGDGTAPFAEAEIIVTTEVVDMASQTPSDGARAAAELPPVESPREESVPLASPPPEPSPPPPVEDARPSLAEKSESPLAVVEDDRSAEPVPVPPPTSRSLRKKTPPRKTEPVAAVRAAEPKRADRAATTGAIAGQTAAGGTTARAGADPGYGARVRAMLQARVDGLGLEDVEGTVVVGFTIDASGAVVSHGLSRSSGSGQIDRSISGMLGRLRFPPPPGGRFAATVAIRIR